ncbi:PepSY domain-containing protein [Bacillaceae bacterium W0354]
MKKKLLVGFIASVVAVGGAIGASALSDSLSLNSNSKAKVEVDEEVEAMVSLDTNTLISVDELYDIVLSEVDGVIEEIELEADNEHKVYFEVEVHQENVEYKVYVDAYSGEVLKVKKDDDVSKNKVTVKSESNTQVNAETIQLNNQKPKKEMTSNQKTEVKTETDESKETKIENKQKTESKQSIISKDQAVNIALGLASGQVTEVELDEDDGHLYYEIEIEGLVEAEIKVDALTGNVIEFELDLED